MKRNILFTLFALLLVFLIGCPSTPPVKAPSDEYDQAKKLKSMITKFGFDSYAPEDFKAGEEQYAAGEANYDKDNAASKTAFDSAITSYKKVMRAGIASRMKDEQNAIDEAAKKADEIKANVATPDEYNAAKATYQKAIDAANADDWENASTLFGQAKSQYEDAYNKSSQKKTKAEDAMDKAKSSIDAVASQAEELDNEGSAGTNP
jgi:hypothetical protein